MAVKKIYGNISVVDAARQRVKNVFSNGTKVYMSFSAGKDSLCMSHIVYDLILHGEINAKQLTVLFVDEESIYESMEQMASAGANGLCLLALSFDGTACH